MRAHARAASPISNKSASVFGLIAVTLQTFLTECAVCLVIVLFVMFRGPFIICAECYKMFYNWKSHRILLSAVSRVAMCHA